MPFCCPCCFSIRIYPVNEWPEYAPGLKFSDDCFAWRFRDVCPECAVQSAEIPVNELPHGGETPSVPVIFEPEAFHLAVCLRIVPPGGYVLSTLTTLTHQEQMEFGHAFRMVAGRGVSIFGYRMHNGNWR